LLRHQGYLEQAESATWEDFNDFRARHPAFQLEDELVFEEGRDVMYD
jgi:transcriptional regulator GlxA family with amidase domain